MSRITAVKRASLADLSHEWDDSCYAYVRPATYEDMTAVDDAKLSEAKPAEQVAFQRKFVESHWVSGKVKILNGDRFELVDMTLEDCSASRAILDKLYADIMGVTLDPKDLQALQELAHTPVTPQTSAGTSGEPSSTEHSPNEPTSQES